MTCRRIAASLLAGLGVLAGACTTTPLPATALETLVAARRYIDAKEPDRARYVLEAVSADSFKDEDLAHYKVLLAETYLALGRYYDTFEALKDFPQKFPTSEWKIIAEELQFKAGRALAATGWTFLGIVSDLDDARRVLEHFVTYSPRSRYLPDALRILGEAAYQQADYTTAILRYSELAQRSPESGWSDLAAFRIAMSHFMLVEGPDYDAAALRKAREELSGYLLTGSTNAAFLDQARAALDQTLQWMEQKALTVARFYLTVGNGRGARIEVERLLANPDARRRSEAVAMLDEAKRLEVAAEDKRGRIKGALVPEPVEAEKGDRGSAGQ